MQRNGTERSECCGFKIHFFRKRHKQITRHRIVFSVNGIAPASTCDALPNFETLHVFSKSNNSASRGISQRHRLVETMEGGLCCWDKSLTPCLIKNLFN